MKPLRKYVTRKEISSARCVELSRFIEQNHHSLVQRTGCSLFLKSNTSVYIKDGHTGYSDFSTGDHGNSIDFLMRYIGYGFVDAVYALNDFAGAKDNHAEKRCDKDEAPAESLSVCRSICLPPPAPRPYRRMYAYLQARGIPLRIISFLENNHLAYQENKHGNIVFLNSEKDYCELRGTFTYTEKPFHGCLKTSADRFWSISRGTGKPKTAYICESAIDAISLLILHQRSGGVESSLYVSIGGVGNQRTIQRVKESYPVILAVDNDPAGDACRQRNPELPYLIPKMKDWNDDLVFALGSRAGSKQGVGFR